MIQFILDHYLTLIVVALTMAGLQLRSRHRRAKVAEVQGIKSEENQSAKPDEEDDQVAAFERAMRSSFDFALLNSGYPGFIQPWVMLRRAVKDLFLSIDDEDESPKMMRVRNLASDLGKTYGMFVWAYDRKTPDDKGHLAHFVETFAPIYWQGMLDAEPKHPMDCYHALPRQTEIHAFLVVAKTGILLAQTNQDRIAEGLLWGALADMMFTHYDKFPLEARNALGNLLECGVDAILILPSFDAFEAPLNKMDEQLKTLKGDERKELRDFVGKLLETYGEKYAERYGQYLESRIPAFAKVKN